jgi:hypothetical protein
MSRLVGVKFERDTKGMIKKVTPDMNKHAAFLEDYLDHLKIEEAKKDAAFIPWPEAVKELNKLHDTKQEK